MRCSSLVLNHENDDQIALRRWITSGLQIPKVRRLHGDSGYLFSNMIAKYTLAASKYRISSLALSWFHDNKVDLSLEYSRSRFYGKNSPLMYEHSIPASVIRSILLDANSSEEIVQDILCQSGFVVVIMRFEDEALSSHGLARKMPESWLFGENPFARYEMAGIELSNEFLKVKGKIQR
jgi:hypothetical protein